MKHPAGHGKGHTGKHANSRKHHHGKAKHHPAHPARQHHHHHKAKVHTKGKHPSHAKGAPLLLGDVACCVAEALAASLRLAGWPVADADVLALYELTARHPGDGASIWDTLSAALDYGLAGVRPLKWAPAEIISPGVILGFPLHAATFDGHGLWTWGEWRPVECAFLGRADEAWEVSWPSAA